MIENGTGTSGGMPCRRGWMNMYKIDDYLFRYNKNLIVLHVFQIDGYNIYVVTSDRDGNTQEWIYNPALNGWVEHV